MKRACLGVQSGPALGHTCNVRCTHETAVEDLAEIGRARFSALDNQCRIRQVPTSYVSMCVSVSVSISVSTNFQLSTYYCRSMDLIEGICPPLPAYHLLDGIARSP